MVGEANMWQIPGSRIEVVVIVKSFSFLYALKSSTNPNHLLEIQINDIKCQTDCDSGAQNPLEVGI